MSRDSDDMGTGGPGITPEEASRLEGSATVGSASGEVDPTGQGGGVGDGAGDGELRPMSLGEARALIAEKHDLNVGKDDPLLIAVTLHQGFVADYERLLERHSRVLAATLAQTGEVTAQAVEQALGVLQSAALESNITMALAKVAEETRRTESLADRIEGAIARGLKSHLWLTGINWLAVAAGLAFIFWAGVR